MIYCHLGNTGIKISVITLGVAIFGSMWGKHWTLSKQRSEKLFHGAVDAGINAFDTANVYNRGESEKWLGEMLASSALRSKLILSTKYGYCTNPKDPNSGGSSRNAMHNSIDKSLKRLQTDYIDILYLHLWDGVTAIEETLSAANDLTKAGKIRYFALSNPPSWYLARADLIGKQSNMASPIAVQLNYNLLSRHLEHDFMTLLDIAQNISLISWGPLANGLLTGRYSVDLTTRSIHGKGRINDGTFTTGTLNHFQPHVPRVIEGLINIASQTGHSPSQIAIAWLLHKKPVTSVVIGVSCLNQLFDNIQAVSIALDPDAIEYLDELSDTPSHYPNNFLAPDVQNLAHGPFQTK